MGVDLIFLRSYGQVFRMNDEVSRNFYFVMLYNNSLSRNSDLGRTQVFCATYDLLFRKFDLVKNVVLTINMQAMYASATEKHLVFLLVFQYTSE